MKRQAVLMDHNGIIIQPVQDKSVLGWISNHTTFSVSFSISAIVLTLFTMMNITRPILPIEPIPTPMVVVDSTLTKKPTIKPTFEQFMAEAIANGVILRMRPTVNSDGEAWLPIGQQVRVIGKTITKTEVAYNNTTGVNYWYKVVYIKYKKGKPIKYEGWVFGDLIRPLSV